VLLLIDDVWSDAAAHAFRVTGPHGRVVYTARDPRVVESIGARPFVIGILTNEAARAVAAGVLGCAASALPPAADRVFAEVDRVALAVALLSAAVRGGRSWNEVASELRRDVDVYGDHPYANTFKAMQIAVAALAPELRAALLTLAVFPPDTAVPAAAVTRYWRHTRGFSKEETVRDLDGLATANVLTDDRDRIRFHDLQRDFLLLHAPALATLHADLLDAYRALLPAGAKDQWWRLPVDEPYVWDHLIDHLRGAGERRALLATVTDPAFLVIRIGEYGVHAAEADLAVAQEVAGAALPVVEWWQAWLRRHAHLLRGLAGAALPTVAPTVLVWLWADPTRPATVDPNRLLPLLAPRHLTPRWGLVPPSNLLNRVLAGHSTAVGKIAWSPDGKQLAASDDDREVRVWDVPGGRTIATLVGHTSEIVTVAWDPNGQEIHTVSDDWEIRVWSAASGQPQLIGGCRPGIEDARRLLAKVNSDADDEDKDEYVSQPWTRLVGSGYTTEQKDGIGHVVAAAWTPDAARVAIASDLGRVWIWDRLNARATAVLLRGEEDVLAVAWSPDGTQVATAGSDGEVVVWDSASGRTVTTLAGEWSYRTRRRRLISLAWAQDGRRLAGTGFGRAILIWDVVSGQILGTLSASTERDLVVAWSPDRNYIAAVGADGTAQVWACPDGELTAGLRGHTETLLALAWSPEGSYLATAGRDREIRLWAPAPAPSSAATGHTSAVVSVRWSPDNRQLATVESDSAVRIWDSETGRLDAAITKLPGHVVAMTWSPDAGRFATAGPYRVARVWDTASGRGVATFTGHSAQVVSIAWSPNGKRLASAALDGEAHIWNPQTGGLLVELVGHEAGVSCIAWSPCGERIATASLDGEARVWNSRTGQTLAVLNGHADWVRALAWSPDGNRLATGGDDREVCLWDPVSGQLTSRIGNENSSIVALAWSPDGRALASCGSDGVLLVEELEGSYTHKLHLESAICVDWAGSVIAVGRSNGVAVFDVH
jgi:WD40 repeat protein